MLTRFALTIWRAATDIRAYVSDFAGRTMGSGFGYLYALTTTIVFFVILPFAISLAIRAPSAETFVNTQLDIVQRWYPDDLVLTLTGGILSTNANEPVILDLPPEWNDSETTHFFVIDTRASVEDFARYETAVLFTQTHVVVQNNESLRVYPYPPEEQVVFTEELLAEGVAATKQYTPMLPWLAWGAVLLLLLLAPFIGGAALWIANLAFLLWATLITLLISAICGRRFSYGTLYKIGLFGITNAIVLSFALTMVHADHLNWLWHILFFTWMTVVVLTFPRRATLATITPPAEEARARTMPKAPRASSRKKP